VLSPWMTVEEAYLLASYLKSIDSHAVFAMSPARIHRCTRNSSSGEDT